MTIAVVALAVSLAALLVLVVRLLDQRTELDARLLDALRKLDATATELDLSRAQVARLDTEKRDTEHALERHVILAAELRGQLALATAAELGSLDDKAALERANTRGRR